jgi:glyoxylase-like metal-dependent hydrolase (beta-lactamase superfamily II)
MPVVKVVHRGGFLQCSSYLIDGPKGAVLVDPGSGSVENEVIEGIRRAGRPLGEVSHLLLTHCHVDHARGAYRFLRHGVRIVAAPHTAGVLRTGGHQVWYEYPECVIPTDVEISFSDGEALDLAGIRVTGVHTPGHTPGCASFLVETADGRAAFIGDLISGAQGNPGWAGSEGFSLEATMASVQKLISHAPQRIYCGHGTVEEPGVGWLRRALARGKAGEWRLSAEFHPQVRPPDFFERRTGSPGASEG